MIYIYTRISTSGQSELSLENQEEACRRQIGQTTEEITVVRDIGSGKDTEQRPNFLIMMGALKPGDRIYIYDQSRLSRNAQQALFFFNEIQQRGAVLYSDGKPYKPDNPNDKLVYTLQSGISEYQRSIQNQKAKEGIRKLYESGNAVFSGKTLGYELTRKKGQPHIEVIDEEARLIRYIYESYLNGTSMRELEKQLVGTPLQRPFRFEFFNVKKILVRVLYTGQYFDTPDMQRNILKYPESELRTHLIKSNLYPPIIEEDLFWSVFRTYRTVKQKHPQSYENRYSRHELTGLFHCPDCNGGMSFFNRWHKVKSGEEKCSTFYISLSHSKSCPTSVITMYDSQGLEELMKICFRLVFLEGGEIGEFFSEKRQELYETTGEKQKAINALDEKLKELDRQLARLAEALINETLPEDIIKASSDRLRKDKDSYLGKKEELKADISASTSEIEAWLENSAQEILDSFDNHRRESYLKYISSAYAYREYLELTYMNGKTFRIMKPQRTSKRIRPEEVRVSYKGTEQYTFVFDWEKYTAELRDVNSTEETKLYIEIDYRRLLEKAYSSSDFFEG